MMVELKFRNLPALSWVAKLVTNKFVSSLVFSAISRNMQTKFMLSSILGLGS